MISYSPNREDVLLFRALMHAGNGFYAEVDFDPQSQVSVTKALYENGWSGCHLLASPAAKKTIRSERKRDFVIGSQEPDCQDRFAGELKQRITALPFHVLSLRYAEEAGGGIELFESLDVKQLKPWIILVRVFRFPDTNPLRERESMTAYLKAAGYGKVFFDGVSDFFLHEDKGDLKEALSVPPNEFDRFTSDPEMRARLSRAREELEKERARSGELARLLEWKAKEIGWIQNSLSWRFTAPLRKVEQFGQSLLQPRKAKPASAVEPPAPEEPLAGLQPSRGEGVIAVDAGSICGEGDQKTPRQAIVRQIVEHFLSHEQTAGLRPMAVALQNELLDVSACFNPAAQGAQSIPASGFEKLLLTDALQNLLPDYQPFFQRCSRKKIEIVTLVHGLQPLELPKLHSQKVKEGFRKWLNAALANSDALICLSETAALGVKTYIKDNQNLPCRTTRIGWWKPGTDGCPNEPEDEAKILIPPAPFAVVSDTFSPRQDLRFVVEAFTRLWKETELPCGLAVVSRRGYSFEKYIASLQTHPEFSKRLWVFKNPGEADLLKLQTEAGVLLEPALSEDSGLPVAELAVHNKPIVLSDLPVYRAVVAENGYFFPADRLDGFKEALRLALKPGALPTKIHEASWARSAAELIELIADNKYQIQLAPRTP